MPLTIAPRAELSECRICFSAKAVWFMLPKTRCSTLADDGKTEIGVILPPVVHRYVGYRPEHQAAVDAAALLSGASDLGDFIKRWPFVLHEQPEIKAEYNLQSVMEWLVEEKIVVRGNGELTIGGEPWSTTLHEVTFFAELLKLYNGGEK